jgi:hypothetical protein
VPAERLDVRGPRGSPLGTRIDRLVAAPQARAVRALRNQAVDELGVREAEDLVQESALGVEVV